MPRDYLSNQWRNRAILIAQLAGTLAILASGLGNTVKLLSMLILWLVAFWPIRRYEAGLFAFACVFFTIMNSLSLAQGIFRFAKPDLLGMPAYEFAMWGFYLLHTLRMVDGSPPGGPGARIWVLALVYAAAFGLIADQQVLLYVTAALLLLGLLAHHEPLDLAYVGYMILLGAYIEYVGTGTGQWMYPGSPPGGVPLWFLTLWGGVGFFLRRLVTPILGRLRADLVSVELFHRGG